jgi:hypothetical protein
MSGTLESIFRHDPITAVIVRYLGPEEICRLTATCRYFRFLWLKKHEQTLFLFTRGHNSGIRTMEDWQANIERAYALKNGAKYCIGCHASRHAKFFVTKELYHGFAICVYCFLYRMRTRNLSAAVEKAGFMLITKDFDYPYLHKFPVYFNETNRKQKYMVPLVQEFKDKIFPNL